MFKPLLGKGLEPLNEILLANQDLRQHRMKTMIRAREEGAVAPLVGILMVVFVLCVALVVDLGHLHNVKIQLQRAVDAAALAGAQLLVGSNQATYPAAVARATAAINRVDASTGLVADGGWVDDTSVVIALGLWDQDLNADPRFTPVAAGAEDTANAIKVTATVNVNYFFFLFASGSGVTADAIAVNTYQKQTIPVAVVSCIPPGGGTFPGVLSPGNSVNDIALYTFGAATEDTAAWSSLSIENANSNNLDKFFGPCGTRLFNKIIYGMDETHAGLENETVKKGGCTTDDNLISVKNFNNLCSDATNITCGLGDPFTGASPSDPLSFIPLPRWDNFADIQRIWSMDGVLTRDEANETLSEYETRLGKLYQASNPAYTAYTYNDYNNDYPSRPTNLTDDRFTRYIAPNKPNDPIKVTGTANFKEPLKEAGYPAVWLIEGETNTIVDFLKTVVPTKDNKLVGTKFKANVIQENKPFDDDGAATSYGLGETVQLTIPVIFTGECTDTKYNKPGLYIGAANLLITRIWNSINDCYDVGNTAVTLQTGADYGRFGSDKNNDILPALVGDKILCTKGFAGKSFEGLIRPPAGDEETKAGIQKIYLVE
jgi:Flp pilus assembly protein TadG